ncbi:MAG: type II toxin-antitoxin system HipA family toxin YjjJ [Proteobacteria bacterium]|nr:type II toxin-antitoxin system HipA family toxin YjjJ [Pseudomonadota bacterium]
MAGASRQLGSEARILLRRGPQTARSLVAALGVSQPTLSRALKTLGDDLVSFGAARSIQYALRDSARVDLHAPIHRVSSNGRLMALGRLIPVCPSGFVMEQGDGTRLHTEGLPWWLFDMRPQGYLGRAYNQQHGARLGLPLRLADWSDTHVLRALLLQGDDLPGNLLVGDAARELFVNASVPEPIALAGKEQAYAELAAAATRGEHHGSSAGGEQPKFTAYAQLPDGPAHVIVKFTALADNPVSQRWRDLLQAEHLALEVLRDHGLAAAHSAIHNHGAQRFLEVRRFDREGVRGRRALFSIAALDAEFVGSASTWPHITRALADAGIVQPESVMGANVLWAFGTLIGNTDMHGGNLSFMSEHGRPYQLAPAYDMTPMAFAPTAGGELAQRELSLNISNDVRAEAWHVALPLAQEFVHRLRGSGDLSKGFKPCVAVLSDRVAEAAQRIARLERTSG